MFNFLLYISGILGLVNANSNLLTMHNVQVDMTLTPQIQLSETIANSSFPQLTAKSILIYDDSKQELLFVKNPHKKRQIASLTKLMTALVAQENFTATDQLIVPKSASLITGSQAGLINDDKINFQDILSSMLIASANDSALTIAMNYFGGSNDFIKLMNQKAQKLGMHNTHFQNVIGFDNDFNYSTVIDLLILTKQAKENKLITNIVKNPKYDFISNGKKLKYSVKNTNELLGKNGVYGFKTGTTKQAGECLILTVKIANHDMIIIILGSENRFDEAKKIIKYLQEKINRYNLATS